jgi:hypothetical protein
LIAAIQYQGELKMQPDKKLADDQIESIVQWIKMGAPWPTTAASPTTNVNEIEKAKKTHWAFQPVTCPNPPAVKEQAWVSGPVDSFILAKLEAKSIKPSPRADRRTLIRRATFDLIGLPPTPAEVDAFVREESPDAFAKLVDRLLASPHYGERWGRHWLDVVRYADSTANDANAVMRYAWRYRNYVIDAFNRDLPYDQFIVRFNKGTPEYNNATARQQLFEQAADSSSIKPQVLRQ